MRFTEYLEILRSPAPEEPIEPKLDKVSDAQAREFREMQDLQQGAILSATLEEGHTDAPQSACKVGDMVVLHYTVYGKDGKVLESTEAGKGGTGSPRVFIIGKGLRMPRGWEIVCAGLRPGQKVRSRIRPAYGFKDPNCRLPAPQGCVADEDLEVDLQLLGSCAGEAGVRCIGQPMPGTKEGSIIKRTLRHPASWENPRPPFEVTVGCSVRQVSKQELVADAPPGEPLYASPAEGVTFTMGSLEAPAALEDALTFMGQDERSLLYVPGAALEPAVGDAFGFPPAVAAAAQVVVELHLLSYVQVRDMTGGGEVVKKRLREGAGEFPVDCPVEDSTVRIHLRARQHAAGPAAAASPWLLDTREAPGGVPLEFPTGMGKVPEGVEMAVKLMLPGEVSLVTCQPSFAYQGRHDVPVGIDADAPVLFEAELLGFERQSHHQVMECAEKISLTRQLKEQGNELFRAKSLGLASQKYTKALKVVQSVHDWDTAEEAALVAQLKVDVLNNLAVVAYHRQQYAEAIDWCSKAIKEDEGQAKAFYRRGMSRSMKGDYEEAEPDLLRAAELDCSMGADVQEAIANNRLRSRTADLKQRREMRAFLSS